MEACPLEGHVRHPSVPSAQAIEKHSGAACRSVELANSGLDLSPRPFHVWERLGNLGLIREDLRSILVSDRVSVNQGIAPNYQPTELITARL